MFRSLILNEAVAKNFSKFRRKHLCWNFILNKAASWRPKINTILLIHLQLHFFIALLTENLSFLHHLSSVFLLITPVTVCSLSVSYLITKVVVMVWQKISLTKQFNLIGLLCSEKYH